MSLHQKAVERMAQYIASTDETNARKVAAQCATIYTQVIGLRPDTATLISDGMYVKAERMTTTWELAE